MFLCQNKENMKIGFDNEKYLKIQSEHIRERIAQFDGKLYMEFQTRLETPYAGPVARQHRDCDCGECQ